MRERMIEVMNFCQILISEELEITEYKIQKSLVWGRRESEVENRPKPLLIKLRK